MSAPLRAVGDDERDDHPKAPKTITEAAKDGDRRELLEATRLKIAQTLESAATPPHTIAALARQLSEVDREIREMGEPEEATHGAAQASGEVAFDASAV